jgi:23S rRNA (cytosine1962-C5)-methyltransferase
MTYPKLELKRGKEAVAASLHPWVFDGALEHASARGVPAGPVELCAAGGALVGVGTYNPSSAIAVRLFSRERTALDAAFFAGRFRDALALRRATVPADTDAFRLVNSEGDGLPGLVIDSFAGHLVAQVGTPGMDGLRESWLAALADVIAPASILLRANQSAANRERMAAPSGQLAGLTPPIVDVVERGVRLRVDPHGGQKTGFFCDQRDTRVLAGRLASGRRVLDCFAYTGAFTAHALAGGALAVTAVESSPAAAELIPANAELAAPGGAARVAVERADCARFLGDSREEFGLVVVDPPALAKRRQHVEKAARLYVELFARGLRRTAPGGFLVACSCSAAVDRELFDRLLTAASREAGRAARIVRRGGAGADHPIALAHPEGEYLKTAVVYAP